MSSYRTFTDSKIENDNYYDTVSHLTTNSALLHNKVTRRVNSTSNSTSNTTNRPESERNSRLNSTLQPTLHEVINYNDIKTMGSVKESREIRQRRNTIAPRPTDKSSFKMLKDLLKNAAGKDLSKMPIPCNFSEPLSFLQRYAEILENSDLLDKAALCEDSLEQMAYVAAFSMLSCATSSERKNKPFNPMLGETFECDRLEDYGWRSIAEQVSHHPPGIAMVLSFWSCNFVCSYCVSCIYLWKQIELQS